MSLTRSDHILDLGKRLVEQLNAGEDLLASWMAHNIAELMDAAANADAGAKAEASDECRRAILELWEHRAKLPDHLRPLEELDPVLRTIASLDQGMSEYRHYPDALLAGAASGASEDARKWLDLAASMDSASRLLIRFALRNAVAHATDEMESWCVLARQAGADGGAEVPAIQFILDVEGEGHSSIASQDRIRKGRLAKLDSFIGLAKLLADELRSETETTEGAGESSGIDEE